ncbi:hypothetical protein STANM309S_02746 [Streptomyces tanashiensis]
MAGHDPLRRRADLVLGGPSPGDHGHHGPRGWAADWEGAEGDYLCSVGTPILEDASRTFTFGLRVDQVIRNATGLAFFAYTMPNEGNPANDSGEIVLNPRGWH